MRMLYCGLPGVGKDYLLDKIEPEVRERNIEVISFGEVLYRELSCTHNIKSRDEIADIGDTDKEAAIHRCIGKILLSDRRLIINSHVVRINRNGIYTGTEATELLRPTFMTCVTAEPSEIVDRANNDPTRYRVGMTEDEVRMAQSIQRTVIENLASRIDLRYRFIDNSDSNTAQATEQLRETISEM